MKNWKLVKCNSRTVKLKPILEKWCSINQQFLKEAESDFPWGYNKVKIDSSDYLFEAKQQWAMLSKKSGKVYLKRTCNKIIQRLRPSG